MPCIQLNWPTLAAGFAEHADDLAVERHLVDAAGLRVRRVEILRRPVRDADRPRLRLVGRIRVQVAEHRMPLLVVRRVQQDEALEGAVAIEHLDAAVVAIGDVDVVLAIDADVVRVLNWPGFSFACGPPVPREPHDLIQLPFLSNFATRELT